MKNIKAKGLLVVATSVAVFAVFGCNQGSDEVIAQVKPTQGNTASGWVSFQQQADSVVMELEIKGLKPNAEHGFHVHQNGDCSAVDGASAGGHFNPSNTVHAHHSVNDRHAGDLPALRADNGGVARARIETKLLTVSKSSNGVIGRSVIIHRDPDDYMTQPAGNSGPRVACGVIVSGGPD